MICLSAPQLNATSPITLLLSTLMIIVREPESQLLFFNMSAQDFFLQEITIHSNEV